MIEWETYLKNRPNTATEQDDFEAGYLAGQTGAEQRVKEKITLLQLMTIERDGAIAKCAELERERDHYKERADILRDELERLAELNTSLHKQLDDKVKAIKAQAGKQRYICDQIPHSETVPCVHCQPFHTTESSVLEDVRKAMEMALTSLEDTVVDLDRQCVIDSLHNALNAAPAPAIGEWHDLV